MKNVGKNLTSNVKFEDLLSYLNTVCWGLTVWGDSATWLWKDKSAKTCPQRFRFHPTTRVVYACSQPEKKDKLPIWGKKKNFEHSAELKSD